MVLNSSVYLVFLAGVCLVSYLFPRKLRYLWLLFCSYGFYLYSPDAPLKNLPALLLLIASTAVSFTCALIIHASNKPRVRKISLLVSLASSIGVLAVCKYTNFFLSGLSAMFSSASIQPVNLLLPLGISYYTLQAASYAIDVYTNKTPVEKNPLLYALYVSFFPGIVTGPINRAHKMLPQYKLPAKFNYSLVSGGLFRILWGLVKKMVIADSIGIYTAAVFAKTKNAAGPELVLAALLFAYQLYADFSGSCDIAIGSARMLGFNFMENFNRPFAAKSFSDLWRRWHISLTSFFRDYLYFPLGGSRVALPRWVFNTLLVFLVSGLWHGASIGYLVWGLVNGVILVFGKMLSEPKEKLVSKIPLYKNQYVRGFFQRIFVYLLFSGAMLFFSASLYGFSLASWFAGVAKGWAGFSTHWVEMLQLNGLPLITIIVLVLGILLVETVEKYAVSSLSTVADWIRRRAVYIRWPLYYLLLAALLVFGAFGKSPFIYQQY